MKKKTISVSLAISSVAASLFGGTTEQIMIDPPASTSGWEYSLKPYAWLTGLDGKIGLDAGGGHIRTASIDAGFDDIWDVVDFAAALQFEARKGRWGLVLDGFYSDLSQSYAPSSMLHTDGKIEMQQFIGELYLAYRMTDCPNGFVDFYSGMRYNYLSTTMTEDALDPVIASDIDISKSADWIDPIIGLRGQWDLNEKWFLAAEADIGGFGVNSDLTWSIQSTIGYHFTGNVFAELGYRYLSTDYDKDSFIYDISQAGLYTGLKIRF